MIKVLLEGPILTRSGYGEHTRLIFKSIYNIDNFIIHINPLQWGQTGWISEQDTELYNEIQMAINNFANYEQETSGQNSLKYHLQIQVGILSEFVKKGEKSICVTAGIETDRVSLDWLLKTHARTIDPIRKERTFGVDKVIVPSNHAKYGFETTFAKFNFEGRPMEVGLGCPVDVISYPVKNIEAKNIDFSLETDFNFLTVGLLGPRKNIEESLIWFLEEFKDDPNVGFIIKTGYKSGSNLDRVATKKYLKTILEKHKDKKCKVYLLHGDLTDEELHSLYLREDVKGYVTTTRGEGFGLPLFEAAYSGLPIIATDWSGHLDFLSAPYTNKGKIKNKKLFLRVDYKLKEIHKSVIWNNILVEGSKWAYCVEQSFKRQMRELYKNTGLHKKRAMQLKKHIQKELKEEKILKEVRGSILGESAESFVASDKDLAWRRELSRIELL
tara:strand:- start:5453 stop:6778 length:1326 start_codon:yes stop_codon:yes gene_type:complete